MQANANKKCHGLNTRKAVWSVRSGYTSINAAPRHGTGYQLTVRSAFCPDPPVLIHAICWLWMRNPHASGCGDNWYCGGAGVKSQMVFLAIHHYERLSASDGEEDPFSQYEGFGAGLWSEKLCPLEIITSAQKICHATLRRWKDGANVLRPIDRVR